MFGILFVAPIVLSGLLGPKRSTRLMILLALAGNLLAAGINAVEGGWSAYNLANRVLSMLSALLVGFLTLRFRKASTRAALLDSEEYRTQHERALRELTQAISGPYDQAAFLDRAARALLEFAGAESVVLGAVIKAIVRAPYRRLAAGRREGRGCLCPVSGRPPRSWRGLRAVVWSGRGCSKNCRTIRRGSSATTA